MTDRPEARRLKVDRRGPAAIWHRNGTPAELKPFGDRPVRTELATSVTFGRTP